MSGQVHRILPVFVSIVTNASSVGAHVGAGVNVGCELLERRKQMLMSLPFKT